jgi:hypothetical protein
VVTGLRPVGDIDRGSARNGLFQRLLSQNDSELSFAGLARIVEGRAFAIAFLGEEKEALLAAIGKADEASFAIGVGSNLQVEFVEIHETVSDAELDSSGVDRLAVRVGNGEIGGAGAEASIHLGDGFRVYGRRGEGWQGEEKNNEGGDGWQRSAAMDSEHTRIEYAKGRLEALYWKLGSEIVAPGHLLCEAAIGVRDTGYQRSLLRVECESIIFGTVTRPRSELWGLIHKSQFDESDSSRT